MSRGLQVTEQNYNTNKMETDNKYIAVAYKLYAIESGKKELEEEAPADTPFQFITGLGMVLESFEAAIANLAAGEKFDFVIPAKDAHGERDEDHVVSLSKEIFYINGKFDEEHVKMGAILPLMTAEGERISGKVTAISADKVTVDLNHPYAGCDLNFVGKVLENRPATNEELAEAARLMSGEGCGCGCDHCGGGCDAGCGSGCDEHDHHGCGGCCH